MGVLDTAGYGQGFGDIFSGEGDIRCDADADSCDKLYWYPLLFMLLLGLVSRIVAGIMLTCTNTEQQIKPHLKVCKCKCWPMALSFDALLDWYDDVVGYEEFRDGGSVV